MAKSQLANLGHALRYDRVRVTAETQTCRRVSLRSGDLGSIVGRVR